MPGGAAALGIRAHSGWLAAVAVAGSPTAPIVLERRRIEIADPGLPGSKQPFHAAESLASAQADGHIQRCRASSTGLAVEGFAALIKHLASKGCQPAAAAILLAAGRPLPDLAAILRSHALILTAEGEFFREIAALACESCRLRVVRVKERDLRAGLPLIDDLGKLIGPPWQQDQKLAALAAWHALS